MANNPFKQTPPIEDVKRNSFDLSFSNNLTLPIGKLVPVMCKEVISGDSFEIVLLRLTMAEALFP